MRAIMGIPKRNPTLVSGVLITFLTVTTAVAQVGDPCRDNYYSQALLIGNKAYSETFEVPYAHNDVEAIRAFLERKLCYRKGNIKVLKDATFNQMRQWLGDANNPRGTLWNRSRRNRSNIFVYYSGHGVPDPKTRRAYLLPTDTTPERASFGYGLDQLENNLESLNTWIGPDRHVTLVLDSCFSGRSAGGVLQKHSGAIVPALPSAKGLVRLSASRAGALAYWDKEARLGLFTSVFLKAVEGAADSHPDRGNKDGVVSGGELLAYLSEEVPYRARLLADKDQVPDLPPPEKLAWRIPVGTPSVPIGEQRNQRYEPDLPAGVSRDEFNRQFKLQLFNFSHMLGRKITVEDARRLGIDKQVIKYLQEKSSGGPGQPVVSYSAGHVFEDCDDCPKMVVVPAGSFMMGGSGRDPFMSPAEQPRHRVAIPKAFAVGRYEITVDQYETFVRSTGHDIGSSCWVHRNGKWLNQTGLTFRTVNSIRVANPPASCISWADARAYVRWLGKRTGKAYRLLSEAEWEYAARAKTDTLYWFGDRISTTLANYGGANARPVDSYRPNGFGLHNVHGNVWEWVEDCWNKSYAGAPEDGSARTDGNCTMRVFRGGAWYSKQVLLRSATRGRQKARIRMAGLGFRVAREVAP